MTWPITRERYRQVLAALRRVRKDNRELTNKLEMSYDGLLRFQDLQIKLLKISLEDYEAAFNEMQAVIKHRKGEIE